MLSHYDYYTGIIFKAYTYGTGEALVTGGRYDNLIEQFGKKASAVGLAIVLDQLMDALASQEVDIETDKSGILVCIVLPTVKKQSKWQMKNVPKAIVSLPCGKMQPRRWSSMKTMQSAIRFPGFFMWKPENVHKFECENTNWRETK